MKTFAFVRASALAEDRSFVSFDHIFIEAIDETDAYDYQVDYEPLMEGYVLLNWYVFECQRP